jgi:hypothetical protein
VTLTVVALTVVALIEFNIHPCQNHEGSGRSDARLWRKPPHCPNREGEYCCRTRSEKERTDS